MKWTMALLLALCQSSAWLGEGPAQEAPRVQRARSCRPVAEILHSSREMRRPCRASSVVALLVCEEDLHSISAGSLLEVEEWLVSEADRRDWWTDVPLSGDQALQASELVREMLPDQARFSIFLSAGAAPRCADNSGPMDEE